MAAPPRPARQRGRVGGERRRDVRHGVQQHRLDLEFILREVVPARQLGKLVGELDASVDVLGRHKVERDLDARGQVAHLRVGEGEGGRRDV